MTRRGNPRGCLGASGATPTTSGRHPVGWRPGVSRALVGLAWIAGWAAGCSPERGPADTRPLVVATIYPVADLTAQVAGDALRVESLLPSRASIHTWEATPGQIRALSQAAGYVTVGGGLDAWLEELAASDAGLETLRLTDGMTLRRSEGAGHDEATGAGVGAQDQDAARGAEPHDGHDHGSGDPHVWLDPILVRDALLPRLTEFLIALLPAEEAGFRARSVALADSLTALDASIRATLAGSEQRGFMATHEAWGYFADRYALTSLGSLYEGPGHEPSARGLARLVDAARAARLTAVLAEPQMAETAARALAGEVGARVVVVDPLGGPDLAGRGRYLDLMRFNALAFAQALLPS